jgi:hypothetical protein
MYYAYHNDFVPELLALKYPKHAVYGGLSIFGESIESLTGVPLDPEYINSYVNTTTDENYVVSQIPLELDAEQERLDARELLRSELQIAVATPDNREIRVTKQQGRILHDDWMSLQPTDML